MKHFNLLCMYFFFVLVLHGCRTDEPQNSFTTYTDEQAVPDSAILREKSELEALPPAVHSKEKIRYIENSTNKSTFKGIGCCEDVEKRQADSTCCCVEVFKVYKEMINKNNVKELKKLPEDPIYGDCSTKTMRETFEKFNNQGD